MVTIHELLHLDKQSFLQLLPAMFRFLVFRKSGLLKVVHPLKVYQHTKFHGLLLTGARLASTSEV
jgi:hypothetical protein